MPNLHISSPISLLLFEISLIAFSRLEFVAIHTFNLSKNLPQKLAMSCASYRYNLAFAELLEEYGQIIGKTNALVGKMRNVKLSAKLRRVFVWLA